MDFVCAYQVVVLLHSCKQTVNKTAHEIHVLFSHIKENPWTATKQRNAIRLAFSQNSLYSTVFIAWRYYNSTSVFTSLLCINAYRTTRANCAIKTMAD